MTDPIPTLAGRSRRPSAWMVLPLLLAAVVAAAVAWRLARDPNVVLLAPGDGAEWVRVDRPFNLSPFREPVTWAAFETTFTVPAGFTGGELQLMALRRAAVRVDGQLLYDTGPDLATWKSPRTVRLPTLTLGVHQLRLEVSNRTGPALVRLACAPLGIHTGAEGWRGSADPALPVDRWPAAVPADRAWEPPISAQFVTAGVAAGHLWPLLLLMFVAGATGYMWVTRRAARPGVRWGRRVRWALLAAWVILGGRNLFRVPLVDGYDVLEHARYVWYVADHWWPPLPTEGWEMFHPPLYYFFSAVPYRIARWAGMSIDTASTWLRVGPLLCGTIMVELCYRAAGHVFPGREGLQAVAATVGGLLPMNLYMGQAVSNEPLAACLGGGVAVVCLRLLTGDPGQRWARRLVGVGLLLGLAILAKLSGLVWMGPAVVVVAIVGGRRAIETARDGFEWRGAARSVAIVLAVAGVVCGWYFVRNQLAIGVPFLSHSGVPQDPWWEDPGYRTPGQFLRFGRGLTQPVYGDLTSIWDDIYATLWSDGMLNGIGNFPQRPPWHYGLMSCGLWLALVPTTLLATGAGRAVLGRRSTDPLAAATRRGLWFATGSIALFVVALLFVCLTWPIYSCVKASYLLSVTPCLAVLAAAGFDQITRTRARRAVCIGLLSCWGATAYLTYFAK